jgi:hypothetical protein
MPFKFGAYASFPIPPTGNLPTFPDGKRNTGISTDSTSAYLSNHYEGIQNPPPTGVLPTFFDGKENTGRTETATQAFITKFSEEG